MSVMLERWNDDKMDSLAAKVDGLGKELREQRQELNARLDGMQRTMIQAAFTLSAAFIAGFAALIAT
jgi:phosphoglycerate-specific signal transduction histidine kinase